MWGANAVNGVINVITKKAQETHGLAAEAGYGNLEPTANARYGAQLGENLHWRTYFNGFDRQNLDSASGGEASDGYRMYQGGFRMDWDLDDDQRLMLTADGFGGEGAQTSDDAYEAQGGNVLTRFAWDFSETSSVQLQTYWDFTERKAGLNEKRHNFDIEMQHDWAGFDFMTLSWGLNYRLTTDELASTTTTSFAPVEDTLHVGTFFVQGQSELLENVVATVGTKLELNSYTGFEYQPSGRLRWSPHEDHHVWGAVSRAIRRPARTDRDLRLDLGPLQVLGNPDFESEELIAFETGYRTTALPRVALELSAFYFLYEKLQTVTQEGGVFGPLRFSNGMQADTYGMEIETTWQALDFLRLVAGYSVFQAESSVETTTIAIERPEDVNPEHQVSLRALIDGPYRTELDTTLSWISELAGNQLGTQPPVEDYLRLDVRLGWQATQHWELSIVGQNLVEDEHTEFVDLLANGSAVLVPRSVFGKVSFRY